MKFYITLFTVLLLGACQSASEKDADTNMVQTAQEQPKKVKNIILMVGDGMGLTQVYAGLTANKGKLNLERCSYIGLSKTYSSDKYITDSAAGATAFSAGKKTYNGAIGVDPDQKPIKTILEIAEDEGLASGLVATCEITHATPASFIAHQPSRDMHEEIAGDFMKTDIDVFIGGGRKYFTERKDGQDLTETLKSNGYQFVTELADAAKVKDGKLAALLAEEALPPMTEGRGDMLVTSAQTAIDILDKNEKGFFLMIEGSQIDWGGHDNNIDYVTTEMVDFDKTIGKVFDFAEKDGETLVIITADHETGGLALTNGDMKAGTVEGKFSTGGHTSVMVPVYAFGPQSEQFAGIYENTAIFDKMLEIYDFGKPVAGK